MCILSEALFKALGKTHDPASPPFASYAVPSACRRPARAAAAPADAPASKRPRRAPLSPKKPAAENDAAPEEEDSQASTSRKRERSPRRTNVAVLFTGIDVDAKARAAVSAAGFALAARWGDATHLVSSVPLRRTPKLLTAVSVARHVVTLGWLWESDALGRAADERPFAVRDRENEAAWRFDLAASLAANGEGAGALADYAVLLDPRARRAGGPKLPKDGELKQIVECAGGVWLATPTKARVALGDRALLLLGDPATPLDASLESVGAAPIRVGVEDFWTAVLSKRCPWTTA